MGHRTNFEKLVRWDADYYKSLTDDDCVVCLTERQIYLLGQIIDQLTWENTRWIGDKSELDFGNIAEDVEYRLEERMTCEKLSTILTSITDISTDIDILEKRIEYIYQQTQIDNGDTVFDIDITTIDDMTSQVEMDTTNASTPTCETSDKDAIYGAVTSLVNYIHTNNVDFLERVTQVGSNFAEQANTIIHGLLPGLELAPTNEALDYAQFIIDEMIEEYNATVDEPLLQKVRCDLFCIAVANNCNLALSDVYDYFAAKVSPSVGRFVTTWANLIQFALIGTFSGDDYFYYMCFLQLATAGFKLKFLHIDDVANYAYYMRAGLNSPDNDWSIFCIDCPEYSWMLYEDFANQSGNWTIIDGVQASDGIEAVDVAGAYTVQMYVDLLEPKFSIKFASIRLQRVHNGVSASGFVNVRVYPNVPPSGADHGSIIGIVTSAEGEDVCWQSSSNAPEDTANNINRQSVHVYCTIPNYAPDTTRRLVVREIFVWGYPASSDEEIPEGISSLAVGTPFDQSLTCTQVFNGEYDPYP